MPEQNNELELEPVEPIEPEKEPIEFHVRGHKGIEETEDKSTHTVWLEVCEQYRDLISQIPSLVNSANEINQLITNINNAKTMIDKIGDKITQINNRIGSLENLGSYVGAFDTFADIPKNSSELPGVKVNDFATIRSDENHGGAVTRYVISNIADDGTITWVFDVVFGTNICGGMSLVPSAINNNIATFDSNGQVVDSGARMLNGVLPIEHGGTGLTHIDDVRQLVLRDFVQVQDLNDFTMSQIFNGTDNDNEPPEMIRGHWYHVHVFSHEPVSGRHTVQILYDMFANRIWMRNASGGMTREEVTWNPWERVDGIQIRHLAAGADLNGIRMSNGHHTGRWMANHHINSILNRPEGLVDVPFVLSLVTVETDSNHTQIQVIDDFWFRRWERYTAEHLWHLPGGFTPWVCVKSGQTTTIEGGGTGAVNRIGARLNLHVPVRMGLDNNIDLNTLDETGFYDALVNRNAPATNDWYNVIHMRHGNHTGMWCTQIATRFHGDGGIWHRFCVANSWQPWIRLDRTDAQIRAIAGTGGTTPAHNNLTGLQGGTANDRQHLTQAQVNNVNTIPSLSSSISSFTNNHNSLNGLQGGNSTQRHHLTQAQLDNVNRIPNLPTTTGAPTPRTAAGVGQVVVLSGNVAGNGQPQAVILPSGGTWFFFAFASATRTGQNSNVIANPNAVRVGIQNGGTSITMIVPNGERASGISGFAWRIS